MSNEQPKLLVGDPWNKWANIFDVIEVRAIVNELHGVKLIIHPNEKGHNIPHIHAEYQGKNISIAIENGKILAGNLSPKKEKIAVRWVLENKKEISERWNELVVGCVVL